MRKKATESDLNVRLSLTPQALIFEVMRSEREVVLRHELNSKKSPRDLSGEVERIVDQAVLEETLPVGTKTRLVDQFRRSYVALLDL